MKHGGRAWPQVGRIEANGEIATGFVAGPRHIITALHAVRGASAIAFILPDREPIALAPWRALPRFDLALLVAPPEALLPAPMQLRVFPADFPQVYVSWGFRVVDPSRPAMLLQGSGSVVARLSDPEFRDWLQLETKHQRPGMSGAPLSTVPSRDIVTAVGLSRYVAADSIDQEPLALGVSIDVLPEEIARELGVVEQSVVPLDARRRQLVDALGSISEVERARWTTFRRLRNLMTGVMVVVVVAGGLTAEIMNLDDGWPMVAVVVLALALLLLYLGSVSMEAYLCRIDATRLAAVVATPDPDPRWAVAFANLLEISGCRRLSAIKEQFRHE